MLENECRAPKVTKETRKIKTMNEKQFHYTFNNKIDFEEIKKEKIKVSAKYIQGVNRNTNHFLKASDTKQNQTNFESLVYNQGKMQKMVKLKDEELKEQSILSYLSSKDKGAKKLKLKTIGYVATFDDFSILIGEFFKECRNKERIESEILCHLSFKLERSRHKIDPEDDSNEHESTTCDTISISKTEDEPSQPRGPKRKPKRRAK